MGQRTKWQYMNVRASGFRIALGMLRNKVRVLVTLRNGDIRSNMRAKQAHRAQYDETRGIEGC